MKKLLIISAAVFFLALVGSPGGFAQNSLNDKYAKFITEFPEDPFATGPAIAKENTSFVNNRALKDFKKSYKPSSEERWYKLDGGGFLVKFTSNGIKNRVDYDKKGRWICTIRYYGEKELPKDVRAQVKSVYYDFTIIQVEELTFPEHVVYIVHMQDETKWMNVRICDGEMDIMQEFLKK